MVAASFACLMCQEVFRARWQILTCSSECDSTCSEKAELLDSLVFTDFSVVNSSVSWALRCVKQLESWKLKLGDPSCLTEAVSAVQLINQ